MKKTYIITYDVNGSEDYDYNSLYTYIKTYKTWAKITESTWAILSEKKPSEIRNSILELLPSGSRVFIIKSGVAAAWSNVICRNEWLKKNL